MTMLATASKPRGERSSVRAMKLPAALLMRSVSGLVQENRVHHFIDGLRVADIDAVTGHAAAIEVHQFRGGFVANDLPAPTDVDLRAEFKEAGGHRLAEPCAASRDKNSPA